MPLSPLEYLRHILDESEYLIAQSETLSKDQFLGNETLKRAFVRSLEVIGEASKKVTAENPLPLPRAFHHRRGSLANCQARLHGERRDEMRPVSDRKSRFSEVLPQVRK